MFVARRCFTILSWTNGVFHFPVQTVSLSIEVNTTNGSIRNRDRLVVFHLPCYFTLVTQPCATRPICSSD